MSPSARTPLFRPFRCLKARTLYGRNSRKKRVKWEEMAVFEAKVGGKRQKTALNHPPVVPRRMTT